MSSCNWTVQDVGAMKIQCLCTTDDKKVTMMIIQTYMHAVPEPCDSCVQNNDFYFYLCLSCCYSWLKVNHLLLETEGRDGSCPCNELSMTDHLEIVITRGNHHMSKIHLSEMNPNSLEDKDPDATSSHLVNHVNIKDDVTKTGPPVPLPSSPPESKDRENDQLLDDIFSETVSIENSNLIDRFDARKQQLLMQLEEQRVSAGNQEGSAAAGLELQLLKDIQLEQLETVQVAIKVRHCFYTQ